MLYTDLDMDKEILTGVSKEAKKVLIKEKEEEPRIPREVSSWLKRIEKNIYLSKPVTDDQTGQVLVTSSQAKKPKIILPLKKQKFAFGLSQKASEAIRWLTEWCLKLIKMHPERVAFKEEKYGAS